MSNSCIILAAGDGKRMKSDKPKVLTEVLFEPMLGWVIGSVEKAGVENIAVVVGNKAEAVTEFLNKKGNYKTFLQTERKGTGHAVMTASEYIAENDGNVLVLCGDAPFMDAQTIKNALEYHTENKAAVTVITAELENPTGYGRIVRDENGKLMGITEEKDCTDSRRLIHEINSGAYWFNTKSLLKALPMLKNNNKSGEYYLTDTVGLLSPNAFAYKTENSSIVKGANSRADLFRLNEYAAEKIRSEHMDNGVEFVGANSYIGRNVKIGKDTVILPNTVIKGNTVIGENCEIGPNSFIEDCEIGDNVGLDNVRATESVVKNNAKAGPFVHLRPGTTILEGVKIGDFVEVKNSSIGKATCIAHLTYVGDSDVGKGVNFGCGCVTANYDGINKFRTKIGDYAFIGCNTNLIAPVEVGSNAATAAGSTITKNVPDDSLAVERGEMHVIEHWEKNNKRKRKI